MSEAYDALPQAVADVFGEGATAETSYGLLTVDVPADRWIDALTAARDVLECGYFDWLSAVDEADGGFRVSARVFMVADRTVRALLVRTTLPRESAELPTAVGVYAGAAWHERETHEMFGIAFGGHPNLAPLLLPENFEGHPLRKDFVLAARVVKAWPGAKDPGESGSPRRRQMLPPGVPDPNEWGPHKGETPREAGRPARAAGRGPAGAAPDEAPRRPRRTRSASAGSTSQRPTGPESPEARPTSAPQAPAPEAPGDRETRDADERRGGAGAPAAPRAPRRMRSASAGSASQRDEQAPEDATRGGNAPATGTSAGTTTSPDGANVPQAQAQGGTGPDGIGPDGTAAGEEESGATGTTGRPRRPARGDAPWHREPETRAAQEPPTSSGRDASDGEGGRGGDQDDGDADRRTGEGSRDEADADRGPKTADGGRGPETADDDRRPETPDDGRGPKTPDGDRDAADGDSGPGASGGEGG